MKVFQKLIVAFALLSVAINCYAINEIKIIKLAHSLDANHSVHKTMVKSLTGFATPIFWGKSYTSLQQGVVDGAENNPPSFYISRLNEVCKYYSLGRGRKVGLRSSSRTAIFSNLFTTTHLVVTKFV